MLGREDVTQFREQGYLLIENFASIDECDQLRRQAAKLVDEFNTLSEPRSRWNVGDPRYVNACNDYFTESLNKVSCFFDPEAFSPEGELLREKSQAIIKMGHALHDCDPVFEEYSHSARMMELARDLGRTKPLIGQSRYFYKQPSKSGTASHQDSAVLYTEPLSCYGVWLALNDIDEENGCLRVIPGSNRSGLAKRVLRDAATGGRKFQGLSKTVPADESLFVPLKVSAGTAVLISGELVHKTEGNSTDALTQVYSVHYIEGAESHRLPEENWLQRPGGFSVLRAPGSLVG